MSCAQHAQVRCVRCLELIWSPRAVDSVAAEFLLAAAAGPQELRAQSGSACSTGPGPLIVATLFFSHIAALRQERNMTVPTAAAEGNAKLLMAEALAGTTFSS